MQETKFFVCTHCKKIIQILKDSPVPLICCGEKMQELKANTVEASVEKHIPVVAIEKNRVHVTVGAALHPMIEEHFIEWIYLKTENGGQIQYLEPGTEPKATFAIAEDPAVAVYAFCNIHGLWKLEL